MYVSYDSGHSTIPLSIVILRPFDGAGFPGKSDSVGESQRHFMFINDLTFRTLITMLKPFLPVEGIQMDSRS